MESSRTSLVSRTPSETHFDVLGLEVQVLSLFLEASSLRKLLCPRPRTALFCETSKFCGKMPETLRKICRDFFLLKKLNFFFCEVEEIKQTKADYDKVNDFQAKTDAALDKLKNRCNDLEEYVQKANYRSRVDALMNELYSKKLNLLIYGIKENEQNVWETKTESRKLVYDFMKDILLLKNPITIKLADVHRLPQHPVFNTAGGKVTRPIIIKLTNSNDKHLIFQSLKNLKTYNESLNLKPKSPGYVYVTEHLPQELKTQKQKLLPHYNKAKSSGKKVSWKISAGMYCLYIEGERFVPK